jgi:hypothetical protein
MHINSNPQKGAFRRVKNKHFAIGATIHSHKTPLMELSRATSRHIVGALQLQQVAYFTACTDRGDRSWQFQANQS